MGNVLTHIALILALPLLFAFFAYRGGASRWEWWTHVLLTASISVWSFLTGRWDMALYNVRYVFFAVVIVILALAFSRFYRVKDRVPVGRFGHWPVMLNVALIFVFTVQIIGATVGRAADEPHVHLDFPLQEGTYYIGQGGSTVSVNYHAAYVEQRYALDIGGLNAYGLRAQGLYPADVERYVIFGHTVYSPCTGEIVEARDGLPDHTPPESDSDHPEGNYVALACDDADDVTVYLAHMQQHTVLVERGDTVEVGQPLGKVGNSGNTTEPHLHIHAEKRIVNDEDEIVTVGVPIMFDGKFLVRNDVVKNRTSG